jgi:hypothetical protein
MAAKTDRLFQEHFKPQPSSYIKHGV